MLRTAFLCLVLGLAAASARAEVSLPAVFGDNMVVQREAKVPVWGKAEAGEDVTVTFGKQSVKATADKDGKWKVELEPLEAGGPFEMTVAGKNTITFKNVLVGDVWLCGGQSNMEFTAGGVLNAVDEAVKADLPQIRQIKVAHQIGLEPKDNIQGAWVEASPQTFRAFTAVGFFFARDLHQDLKVPIGLLNSNWGGTPAEAWTSKEGLEADEEFKPILDRAAGLADAYPKQKEAYEKALEKWKADAEAAKAAGKPEPKKPNAPPPPESNPHRASVLYNGMIKPLVPFAIKGVIWYQGEANAGRAFQYRKLFPNMIQDWRKQWNQEFPFLFVQLANYMARKPDPSESAWAELREAQTMTLALPKTGMAVIIDTGEEKNIHPKNKQDVGKRLALAARHIAYGKDLVYAGPMFDTLAIEGSAAKVTFKHTGGGLEAKDGDLKGFAVAGEDKKFVWASAKIDGNTVVVSSDKVEKPVAVRYAWADNPECNLYNKEGLPACPFRTDTWDGVTKANK
ncbi:MAG: sialate O-acetylesterase [Planctomycetota bacterium]|nr:sialate O-acetylesterase [Planctomycetota bacterium]